MLKSYLSFFLLISSIQIIAQPQLPMPLNLAKTYDKKTRTVDGKPGLAYWQNTADYSIDVLYEPVTRLIKGKVNIYYTNNSPDTLNQIWFKLYPNLYQQGVQRMSKIKPEDTGEGITIGGIRIPGEKFVSFKVDGTNMVVTVPPVLPGTKIQFDIEYHYFLNKGSHYRTGEIDENTAFVAYFFPRIAVYDDIDGWNKNPYLGTQEFYNDFCNFKATITVPKDFVVWATGDLKNCNEVLAEKYCQRLSQSEKSEEIINIIDTFDLNAGNITTQNEFNKWKFEATNVTDFVFATSDHYVWQSSSLVVDPATQRRTRTGAAFNPDHHDFFEVTYFNRETVRHMSYSFPKWPFPYQHITVIDGLDQMEYPMMVNDNPVDTRFDAITLTDHEVFHTMFPFYMGINETKYGWMDEGWATIGEWLISPMIDSTIEDDYGMSGYENAAGKEIDLPITTLTTQQNGTSMFINSYPKPALGYLYVKDLLGDELFYKGLHYYIAQWNGKHPMPYDFFNCMNTGSGKNLNWFWKNWFMDDGVPDLGITKVRNKRRSVKVTITKKGHKAVPVDLIVWHNDGSKTKMHKTIAVWENNNQVKIKVRTDKKVSKITLGSLYTADINKSDNEIVF